MSGSVPTFLEFDPRHIPWQLRFFKDLKKFKYEEVETVMLSGSVGSAKSLASCHAIILHCLENPGAHVLIGRKTLPSLKDTLLQMIIDHIGTDIDYELNQTRGNITIEWNGAKITSYSWADKKFKKCRSMALSMAVIEEITENEDPEFFKEIYMRVGRIPGIKNNLILVATNPDSPSHWCYDYFIRGAEKHANRHVYYSLTKDNPFLPSFYIENLRQTLTAKEFKRMAEGQWLHLLSDTIYYAYEEETHYVLEDTKIDPNYPLRITHDFNIGTGKPMSCTIFQYIERKKKFIFLDEVVMEGTRTGGIYEEIAGRGWLDHKYTTEIIVHGDANGKNSDTRGDRSDYDIIDRFLSNYERKDGTPLDVDIDVQLANPRIRDRHNLVNGLLRNGAGRVSILLDKRCKVLNDGLMKTRLKENGSFVEVEDYWQHITTALGYACHRILNEAICKEPIVFQ